MAGSGAVKMDAGPGFRVKSILAWNPETLEVTSGPASGQFAKDENEAISKHKAAVEAANKEN